MKLECCPGIYPTLLAKQPHMLKSIYISFNVKTLKPNWERVHCVHMVGFCFRFAVIGVWLCAASYYFTQLLEDQIYLLGGASVSG